MRPLDQRQGTCEPIQKGDAVGIRVCRGAEIFVMLHVEYFFGYLPPIEPARSCRATRPVAAKNWPKPR